MPLTQVKTSNLDTTNSLFFRNRIINGDMRIAQRATSVASAGGAGGVCSTVDRFGLYLNSAAVVSEAQVTDAPTGFTNSVKYTVTTADTSVAAGDYILPFQRIEGNNIADLSWGTASAKTVTLSFWVKSSKTGIYYVGFRNGSFARSYAAPYTISASNTWEYKTINVPGETTGTWTTDNSEGLGVFWWLMGGSDFNASSISTWVSANTTKFSNQVNWADTVGATFQITGVQLEAGTAATAFERRPFGTELALCQRYTWVTNSDSISTGIGNGGTNPWCNIVIPIPMRATPTLTVTGQLCISDQVSVDAFAASPSITDSNISSVGGRVRIAGWGVTLTSNRVYTGTAAGGSGKLTFNAEL
jgi:hypothetical protein